MRIYISGPVTGYEDTAKMRFKAATEYMKYFIDERTSNAADLLENAINRQNGKSTNEVINPFAANAKIAKHAKTMTHADYMVTSMAMLAICDAICMLKGWEQSEGCKEEYEYAKAHGYKIIYQTDDKVIYRKEGKNG